MALSPIQMFRSNESSLAQILAGGNQAITGIMDRAIQIGRDLSNKQLAQERDMLAMRQQETNLFQRRGENLQQNNEDAQNFARRAFESDRRYGMEQQQEARIADRDLFSRGMETERLDLSRQQLDLSRENADRSYDLSKRRVAADERGMDQELAARDAEALKQKSEQERIAAMLTRDISTKPPETKVDFRGEATSTKPDFSISKGKAEQKRYELDALIESGKLKNDPQALAAATQERDEISRMFPTAVAEEEVAKEISPSEARLQRAEGRKFVEETIKTNPGVFTDPLPFENKKLREFAAKAEKKPEDVLADGSFAKEDPTAAKKLLEFSSTYGGDRLAFETAAVNRATSEDAYVDAGGTTLTAREKQIRRDIYRAIRGEPTAPGAAAPSSEPTGLDRFGLD